MNIDLFFSLKYKYKTLVHQYFDNKVHIAVMVLNLGKSQRVKVGDLFSVVEKGKLVENPQTSIKMNKMTFIKAD